MRKCVNVKITGISFTHLFILSEPGRLGYNGTDGTDGTDGC